MLSYRYSRLGRIAIIIFFLIVAGYGYFESRAILYGPRIIIASDVIVLHDPFTKVEGRAENIAELRMNGAAISVTEDGKFSEPYLAASGESQIVLDAKDKYGRTSQEIIEVVYTPDVNRVAAMATTTVHSTTTPAMTPVE